MGKYDQYLAGLPADSPQPGKYDAFTKDLPSSDNSSPFNPALKEALGKIPGLAQKLSPMIPGIEPLTTVADLAPTAEKIHAGFPKVAGDIAEKMGAKGYSPNASALATLPLAIAPEIAALGGMGIGEVVAGSSPLARAIRTTPKALGPEFQAGEKLAGISGDLPIQRGGVPRFPNLAGQPSLSPPPEAPLVAPKSYPKDFPSFLNFAKARVTSLGDKLSPQELDDYKTMLSTSLSKMKAQGLAKTEPFALGSQLQKDVTALHNTAIPGREELNRVYALSKTIHPDMAAWVKQGVNKYGAKAIGAVLAGLGIGAGAKLASK